MNAPVDKTVITDMTMISSIKLIDPWGTKLNYVKIKSTTQDNDYISSVWSNGPNKTNDSNSETFSKDDIGIINY